MSPSNGLNNSKLQLATAGTGDVLSGKTFYAGDKNLKTGTFNLGAANATPGDVRNGKTFYAGDNTLKTGTLINYTGTVDLLQHYTGQYANGPWNLNVTWQFYGYGAFIVIAVARNEDAIWSIQAYSSSGWIQESYLQAIAMEDDATYTHAKVFSISNADSSYTSINVLGTNGTGWGIIVYGIK